ncbi:MAG: copper amine oxidase N-terminal domain-containing protein [Oscillospiraceae bacterium]|nr:copper amine oxidase N-terminal domain-containing protein [Oscillospiraceae bacterium]
MKNKLWKALITCLLVVALLSVSVWAVTDTVKNLEAHYTGISLVVNGVQVTPKDANGKVVDPFIVDGTTYLPVRAVASALGEDVNWEGSTRTVYIGEIPGQETNWMKKLPPYHLENGSFALDGSDTSQYFTVSGMKHTIGVLAGMNRTDSSDGITDIIWNTNSLYQSMEFTIGHSENNSKMGETNSTVDITVKIYLGGEFYDSVKLNWSDPPTTVVVDLDYCENVRLELINTAYYYGATYGLYDISFA